MRVEERVRSALETEAAQTPHGDPIGAEEAMRKGGRRRTSKRVGVAVIIIVAFVGFVFLAIPSSNVPVAGPGIDLDTVPSPAEILSDGAVTDDEYEMAGLAVVQCLADVGIEASFNMSDESFTTAGAESTFDGCYQKYMSESVQKVWADQNYDPEADFRFYADVVECTEAKTGDDYGEMTQDSLGFASTEARRTIDRAIAEAPGVYEQCLSDALNGVLP